MNNTTINSKAASESTQGRLVSNRPQLPSNHYNYSGRLSRLRKERIDKGYSLSRLSYLLNTHPSTISRWENLNRHPKPIMRAKLENVFGIPAHELMEPLSEEEIKKYRVTV